MSRIVVKNLPKKISKERLRKVFGDKGVITDVQLKYTSDGKFRRFAFIGYEAEDAADTAVKYFHNSMVDACKISVELCSLLGDETKPKSWSKYSTDSTAYKSLHKKEQETRVEQNESKEQEQSRNYSTELLQKYKDDPLFEEFLQVQVPNIATDLLAKVQAIDKQDLEEGNEKESEREVERGEEEVDVGKPANQAISDLEYMQLLVKKPLPREKQEKLPKEKVTLFTLKLHGLPYTCKKKDIKQFFKPLSPYSIRVPRAIKGIAYVGFKLQKQFNKALLKNKSFISGKQISVFKYEKKEECADCDQGVMQSHVKDKWKSQEESLKHEENVAESGRIFVRNLSYTSTEEDVQNLFTKFGPLTEVNLPIDSTTRKHKGFGLITFLMPEHAVRAFSALDGSIFHGRMLHLLPGKAKDDAENDANDGTTNFKAKKEQKLKARSGSAHNWNSLFLGHNSVAEVIADTYRTSKENVLDPHGDGNAAVRLALGETQIVTETRKYLEREGVVLEAFSQPATRRSKSVILVKNLPANTRPKELHDLFSPHGLIGRIVLPPSGITALIEYAEPSEARKAFTRLAYTKFKNLPLYLEWAPENSLLLKSDDTQRRQQQESSSTNNENEPKSEESEEDEAPEEDTTLFVKNLNFKTTDADLQNHFQRCGKIKYANVAVKKDKSDPQKRLSMGYGFVRFMHKASADKALKTMQQSQLDGKSLELKRSERTLPNEVQTARKLPAQRMQTGTKILIRNIPFQAKKSEVTELFKTFGELKAIRLPKKVGSDQHRGFAFVDYSTKSEAKKAFAQLSQSTHLYGRRLVLEWASNDEEVDDIRKRTAEHFRQTAAPTSKKSVLSIE